MPTTANTKPLIRDAQAALNTAAGLIDSLTELVQRPGPIDAQLLDQVGRLHTTLRVLDGFVSDIWGTVHQRTSDWTVEAHQ